MKIKVPFIILCLASLCIACNDAPKPKEITTPVVATETIPEQVTPESDSIKIKVAAQLEGSWVAKMYLDSIAKYKKVIGNLYTPHNILEMEISASELLKSEPTIIIKDTYEASPIKVKYNKEKQLFSTIEGFGSEEKPFEISGGGSTPLVLTFNDGRSHKFIKGTVQEKLNTVLFTGIYTFDKSKEPVYFSSNGELLNFKDYYKYKALEGEVEFFKNDAIKLFGVDGFNTFKYTIDADTLLLFKEIPNTSEDFPASEYWTFDSIPTYVFHKITETNESFGDLNELIEKIYYPNRDSLAYVMVDELKEMSLHPKMKVVKELAIKNEYNGVNDTIRTYAWLNSHLEILASKRRHLSKAIINDPNLVLMDSIYIGASENTVEMLLKSVAVNNKIAFMNLEGTHKFTFYFKNNLLYKILYEGSID